ncbi:hypothetical protein [Nitrosomonas nitrosa]|uniref:hypothetical protein n=1 Tax=Nitrosomonas nitrosa TaxID=52442 RepID=UPI000D30DE53|nr:hypothetical protein [Nitrosomonas nitrosa]
MRRFFNEYRLVGFKLLDPVLIRLDHRIAVRFNQPVHQLLYFAVQLLNLTFKRLPALFNLRLPVTPPCLEHLARGLEQRRGRLQLVQQADKFPFDFLAGNSLAVALAAFGKAVIIGVVLAAPFRPAGR